MSTPSSSREDPARILRERDSLNEQIKLLVKTEQRLYRSQNALDEQLARVRELADYSLRCSIAESQAEILERALELLRDGFHVDRAVAIELEPTAPRRWSVRGLETSERQPLRIEVDAEAQRWVDALPRSSLTGVDALAVVPALRSMDSTNWANSGTRSRGPGLASG